MSDSAHDRELIIVRRHEEEEHAHHSSAWKVAHADFMTAMMAFFLIMWLINVTDDEVRKGISQYFNPIHLSTGSADAKGLNAASDTTTPTKSKAGHSDSPPALNPLQLTTGNPDPIALSDAQKALIAAQAGQAAAAAAAAKATGQETAPGAGGSATGAPADAAGVTATPGGDGADARERAAFQDPYAILARLAEKYTLDHPTSVDTIAGDDSQAGVAGGDVDRDPFDPVYWQVQPLPPAKSGTAGESSTAQAPPPDALPDAQAAVSALSPDQAAQLTVESSAPTAAQQSAPESQTAGTAAAPPSPAATPPAQIPPAATAMTPAPANVAAETVATSAAVDAEIAKSIEDVAAAGASPEVSVKATPEGVLINLTDDAAFSMFAVGSAIPDPKVVVLMERIAKVLGEQKGDVIVRGYTDGRPFRSDTYDNWRLSAARAHMAYYMLVRGGLEDQRVVAIEGHADRNLKIPADPLAAENRRIEILVKEAGT